MIFSLCCNSYISGPSEQLNTDDRRRLQERYRHIVDQITHHQRDRINTTYPPGSSVRSNDTFSTTVSNHTTLHHQTGTYNPQS